MNNKVIFICALIVVYIICLINIGNFSTVKRVCNELDKRCYRIIKKYDTNTHTTASEKLAYLNKFCIKLIKHLRNKYLWRGEGSNYRKEMVAFLLYNYNPDNIIENAPSTSVNTSYVEDKGRVFAICLREKESGLDKFHENNILEYVAMHEIAHMATEDMGHGDIFWANFRIIINEAKNIGLHSPIDYRKEPTIYCSLKISYNPYFDDTLPKL
jgi:hypothetical protein